MPHRTPYDSWAEYYDLTRSDYAPYIAFYASLLTRRTQSLLDLGCGTGTITIALARRLGERWPDATRRVVGVDKSKEMLAHARTADEHIDWVVGDMRAPPAEGTFDLVISCFNTLQLLPSGDDLARTFRSVRQLLSRDGIFAFDIYQPNLEYLSVPQTDRLACSVTDDQGQPLEIREETRYDPRSRCLTIDWRLVAAGEPEATPRARTRYRMRQYFPDEIDRLLTAEELAVRERYGDVDRSPFTPVSKKQVLVCGAA